MFKTFLLSLFATMAVTAVAATYPASYYTLAPETTTVVGDVNNDGTVTSVDVTALYNYLLNGDASSIVNGDQDGDGKITSVDVTVIYNVLLNGSGGTTPATSITMKEYKSINSSTSANHTWTNVDNIYWGDVIYITLDGVEENMYVLVRKSGKWQLNDVGGSNKAGFKSSGTIKAIWVRGAAWQTNQVGEIKIPYDYATGSGTYKLSGKTVSLNLNLTLTESLVRLTGPVPNQILKMTYCERVNYIYNINRACNGQTGETTLNTMPYSEVYHIGSDYYAFGVFNDVNASGNTVYHATTNYGRSYRRDGTSRLTVGRMISIVNPYPYDESNGWVRDFVMTYYNRDGESSSQQRIYPGQTANIRVTVGTEISFIPQEGGLTDSGSTMSRSSSNSNVVSAYASSVSNSTACKAMSVGECDVNFTYNSHSTDKFSFKVHFIVDPTVWIAGKANGSPVLFRNNKMVYNSFSVNPTKVDRVFVRKGHAYLKADGVSTNYILYCSNPHYGASFSTRKTTPMTQMLVTRNEDIYYANNKDVYKNNTKLVTYNDAVGDIQEDESTSKVWLTLTSEYAGETVKGTLIEDVGGQRIEHKLDPVSTMIPIGGTTGHTRGYISPHFRTFLVNNGTALIDVVEDTQTCYSPQGEGGIVWNYREYDKLTVSYTSSGFVKKCTRGFENSRFVFYDYAVFGNNVYYANSSSGYKCYNLNTGDDVALSSYPRPIDIKAVRYRDSKIYAVTKDRLYIYNIGASSTIIDPYILSSTLSEINDVFLETSIN